MLPGNIRLSGMPIKNGYVLWTEDISELIEVVAQLEELDEDLEGRHTLLREEYETSHRRRSLTEKNRLYNQMQNQTKDTICKLSDFIEKMKNTGDASELSHIGAQIAVITAYLKRRSNLIFIAEENGTVHASELSYSLTESLNSLRLLGADCEMDMRMEQALPLGAAGALYDAFETAVEHAMDSLKELFVSVSLQSARPTLCLSMVCDADLTELSEQGFYIVREDENEWTAEYSFMGGGEKA